MTAELLRRLRTPTGYNVAEFRTSRGLTVELWANDINQMILFQFDALFIGAKYQHEVSWTLPADPIFGRYRPVTLEGYVQDAELADLVKRWLFKDVWGYPVGSEPAYVGPERPDGRIRSFGDLAHRGIMLD